MLRLALFAVQRVRSKVGLFLRIIAAVEWDRFRSGLGIVILIFLASVIPTPTLCVPPSGKTALSPPTTL
jgi:hypothetical protein